MHLEGFDVHVRGLCDQEASPTKPREQKATLDKCPSSLLSRDWVDSSLPSPPHYRVDINLSFCHDINLIVPKGYEEPWNLECIFANL